MLKISPIPAFNDNYLWLIEGTAEHADECWVVDPGDASAVKAVLAEKGRKLDGILVTHHHPDHVGGIAELIKDGMRVIGPALSQHPLVNEAVSDGQELTACGEKFRVFELPGHTLNHVAYYSENQQENNQTNPVLFCGDTLFAAGCGRLFEGTPEQMLHSLERLAELPESTQVYCAHEYTVANLAFARHLEPDNADIKQRSAGCIEMRKNDIPTIPSNLGEEKKTNPFLRTHLPEFKDALSAHTGSKTLNQQALFTFIRKMKDQF